METATAFVERNEITTNFKANVAFGGEFSGNTVLINNNISLSRAEGVFALESGYTWLQGNTIQENNDGIIMFDSSIHLYENHINENTRTGIIMGGTSFPLIERNSIYGNSQCGIIIREASFGTILNNKVHI